jgi:hypothetical protein
MIDNFSREAIWPPVYKVKRHRQARYVKLRASAPARLEITVPFRFNLREIPFILEKNKEWIENQLSALAVSHSPIVLPDRVDLRACYESWQIAYLAMKKKMILIQRHQLKEMVLMGNISNQSLCRAKLVTWVKAQAQDHLSKRMNDISRMMQLSYSKITIRDQKTLWGSCTVNKAINLNYKLLFLPPHLVTYVIIHELAHTVHLNHSKQFWDLVGQFDAEWRLHRSSLKDTSAWIPAWINR